MFGYKEPGDKLVNKILVLTHVKYESMIRPILEYACMVWSPYTRSNIDLPKERLHARFVCTCNDYSYLSSVTTMLQQLN